MCWAKCTTKKAQNQRNFNETKTLDIKKKQLSNGNVKRVYNLFRNRVNKERLKAKKDYYSQYFSDNSKDSKKIWDGIKSIINLRNPLTNSNFYLKKENSIIEDPKKIADSFNDFFANVGPSTDS